MDGDRAPTPLIGGVGLLERAISYTLGSLLLVAPEAMRNPTPCRDWDLRQLLQHMNDSLKAMHEAAEDGHVELGAARDFGDSFTSPVATLRNRACTMLGAWAAAEQDYVSIGDRPLASGIVAAAGAVEITVHGWDVAMACLRNRPIPAALAEELLPVAEMVVADADRPGRFAPALPVPVPADPGARLLGFLGRDPFGRL